MEHDQFLSSELQYYRPLVGRLLAAAAVNLPEQAAYAQIPEWVRLWSECRVAEVSLGELVAYTSILSNLIANSQGDAIKFYQNQCRNWLVAATQEDQQNLLTFHLNVAGAPLIGFQAEP